MKKLMDFLKTLTDEELKEALNTMWLLTNPLSVELIRKAALPALLYCKGCGKETPFIASALKDSFQCSVCGYIKKRSSAILDWAASQEKLQGGE